MVLASVFLIYVRRWRARVFSGRSFGLAGSFYHRRCLVPIFQSLKFYQTLFSATKRVDFPSGSVGFFG